MKDWENELLLACKNVCSQYDYTDEDAENLYYISQEALELDERCDDYRHHIRMIEYAILEAAAITIFGSKSLSINIITDVLSEMDVIIDE